jgi:Glycosyltransferase family 87
MTAPESESPPKRHLLLGVPLSVLPGALAVALGVWIWGRAFDSPEAPTALAFGIGHFGILLGALCFFLPGHRGHPRVLLLGLGLGLIARIFLFAQVDPFALSDDAARYAFEGEMLASGMSPWHHAPDSPRLDAIVGERGLESLRASVNHPEIATIYSPLAEASFTLCALLSRLSGADTLFFWRLLAQLGDLFTLILLAAFLRSRARALDERPTWAWLLAWWLNPLVLSEVTISAHLDVWAAATLLAALFLLESRRGALAAAALGAAIFIKIVAALLLPLFFFCSRGRAFILGMSPWVGLAALCVGLLLLRPQPEDFRAKDLAPAGSNREIDSLLSATIADWERLLGHYRIESRPGHPLAARHLYFDGRGLVVEEAPRGADSPVDPLFYEAGPDGRLCLVDRGGRRIPLRLSARRQLLELDHPAGTIIGWKGEDAPLMGLRQYASRWTAHAPLTRWLASHLDERAREGQEAARRLLALFMVGLGFILGFFGGRGQVTGATRTAGTLLALFWVAAPALYPWYLLWVLPLAIVDRRPGLFAWASLFPLFHLVEPARGPLPSLSEAALILVVSLAFIIDLIRKRRR